MRKEMHNKAIIITLLHKITQVSLKVLKNYAVGAMAAFLFTLIMPPEYTEYTTGLIAYVFLIVIMTKTLLNVEATQLISDVFYVAVMLSSFGANVNRATPIWFVVWLTVIGLRALVKVIYRKYIKTMLNLDYLCIRKVTDPLPPEENLFTHLDISDVNVRVQRINEFGIKNEFKGTIEIPFTKQVIETGVVTNLVKNVSDYYTSTNYVKLHIFTKPITKAKIPIHMTTLTIHKKDGFVALGQKIGV